MNEVTQAAERLVRYFETLHELALESGLVEEGDEEGEYNPLHDARLVRSAFDIPPVLIGPNGEHAHISPLGG